MNAKEVAALLRRFNAWRRGENCPMPDQIQTGRAIDAACELLDELDELRKDKARLDWLDAQDCLHIRETIDAAMADQEEYARQNN